MDYSLHKKDEKFTYFQMPKIMKNQSKATSFLLSFFITSRKKSPSFAPFFLSHLKPTSKLTNQKKERLPPFSLLFAFFMPIPKFC